MSNYIKSTDFSLKDSLVSGDPNKIVRGSEVDNEFNNIATAISSKSDKASPSLTGNPTAPTPPQGDNSTRIATTAFVQANSVPIGCILMWGGSIVSIPVGYSLCNGSNGTPDLRDRFIIAAGSNYSIGNTGGNKDAALVEHNHVATSIVNDPSHYHTAIAAGNDAGGATIFDGAVGGGVALATSSATTGITVDTTITSIGVPATNANLPPYYALAFIQRVS